MDALRERQRTAGLAVLAATLVAAAYWTLASPGAEVWPRCKSQIAINFGAASRSLAPNVNEREISGSSLIIGIVIALIAQMFASARLQWSTTP